MTVKTGHVDPWWGVKHRDLGYVYRPINFSNEYFLLWKSQGYDRFNINGWIYDMSSSMPDYADGFFNLHKWNDIGISFYQMKPFDFLPAHRDHYSTYIKKFKIDDPKKIWRTVVFLEDWKSGHYFEIDGVANTNWKAGDWVSWQYNVEHAAGNIGTEDRYTVQITGWVDEP